MQYRAALKKSTQNKPPNLTNCIIIKYEYQLHFFAFSIYCSFIKMQRLHPDQQNSSLGISKALQEEVRMMEDAENSKSGPIIKKSLTDSMFKVPTKEANLFIWVRFYISLYYNKVCFSFLVLFP